MFLSSEEQSLLHLLFFFFISLSHSLWNATILLWKRRAGVFFLFFLHFLFWLAVPAWNGRKLRLLRNKPVYSVVAAVCIYPWTSVIRLKGHPHQNDNHKEKCNKDVSIHTRERQHSVNNGTEHYPVVIWRGHQWGQNTFQRPPTVPKTVWQYVSGKLHFLLWNMQPDITCICI